MRKRFTQEFKQDAVSQVTDKGFPVVEVAERLGVSSHSHRRPCRPPSMRSEPRTARAHAMQPPRPLHATGVRWLLSPPASHESRREGYRSGIEIRDPAGTRQALASAAGSASSPRGGRNAADRGLIEIGGPRRKGRGFLAGSRIQDGGLTYLSIRGIYGPPSGNSDGRASSLDMDPSDPPRSP
jgi:hypothetical protein